MYRGSDKPILCAVVGLTVGTATNRLYFLDIHCLLDLRVPFESIQSVHASVGNTDWLDDWLIQRLFLRVKLIEWFYNIISLIRFVLSYLC